MRFKFVRDEPNLNPRRRLEELALLQKTRFGLKAASLPTSSWVQFWGLEALAEYIWHITLRQGKFLPLNPCPKPQLLERNSCFPPGEMVWQVLHVKQEKSILQRISHPFVVNLLGCCQDDQCVPLITEYVCGGEFFTYFRSCGRFDDATARFYASQVLCAFEYLHGMDIMYRDLKWP
uniref:Protein kinase domain-containing protein n=1 Tax=Physcomitrium patens TaxID=3218 RepID=A0A7I4AN52_PHYPA